jgi:hypothetical protein
MKKTSTHFEPQLWKDDKKRSGLQLMENFYQFNDLASSKEKLNSIMSYAIKRNSWIRR